MAHDLLAINDLDEKLDDIRLLLESIDLNRIEPAGITHVAGAALQLIRVAQGRLQQILN